MSFVQELKRRNVFRVGVAYLIIVTATDARRSYYT
jgi:hypothetical protein